MATLSYTTGCGTFQFFTLYKSQITSRPIYDEAERTAVAVEHTIRVQGYVNPPVSTRMEQAKEDLTARGGHLKYKDKGNDIEVNAPGSRVRDCRWGPVPTLISFTPLGGDCNAARIEWEVKTVIPECCEVVDSTRRLMALNFEVTYDIDEAGYNTERVSGYFEIPMTRRTQSDRSLPDCADLYTKEVLGRRPVALGYQRKHQTRTVSKDKRRVDFSWVDVELPMALPRNVARIDATHSCETSLRDGAFRMWMVNFEATIEMARGVPQSESLAVFLRYIEAKTPETARVKSTLWIPQRFAIVNHSFRRRTVYSFRVLCTETLNVRFFLENQARLWEPIPDTDFTTWRTSLRALGVDGPTGGGDLYTRPGEDMIVDLCLNTKPTAPAPSTPGKGPYIDTTSSGRVLQGRVNPDDVMDPGKPPPESSWIRWENRLRFKEDSERIRHKPLPREPLGGTPTQLPDSLPFAVQVGAPGGPGDPAGVVGGLPLGEGGGRDATRDASQLRGATGGLATATKQGSMPHDIFQQRAGPTRTLIMHGSAVRYGYRVPVPTITHINGVPVVEMYREVEEDSTDLGVLGVPIFRMDWMIEYALPYAPNGIFPYLANPVHDTSGGSGVVAPL